jgi:hypothetical protein
MNYEGVGKRKRESPRAACSFKRKFKVNLEALSGTDTISYSQRQGVNRSAGMGIIATIIIGLLVGAVAKLLTPGEGPRRVFNYDAARSRWFLRRNLSGKVFRPL